MADKELESSGILRLLPSINELLNTETAKKIEPETGANRLTEMARTAVESLRRELVENKREENFSREDLLTKAEQFLEKIHIAEKRKSIQRVINATGVIIHTNLGRAPLSETAVKAISENASRYCTLEYDLETGKRGKRGRTSGKSFSGNHGRGKRIDRQ